jgi:hypothetical protein
MDNIQLSQVVDAIIATREFFGNEREAARDCCAEIGIRFTDELFGRALSASEEAWRGIQRAAGVSAPLSGGDRASAFAAIQHAA